MVSFLLSKGAHVNVRDRLGRTPAMIATELGNDTILNLLIEKNADLTLRDEEGQGGENVTSSSYSDDSPKNGSRDRSGWVGSWPERCWPPIEISLPRLPAHKYV